MDLLGVVFPKRCVCCRVFGEYLCSECFSLLQFSNTSFCFSCGRPSESGITHRACLQETAPTGIFFSLQENSVLRRLISQYTSGPHIHDLQYVLSDLFYEGLIQQESFYHSLREGSIFMPFPLGSRDEQEAAMYMTHRLAERFKIPVLKKATQITGYRKNNQAKQIYLINLYQPTKLQVAPVIASLRREGMDKIFLLVLATKDTRR